MALWMAAMPACLPAFPSAAQPDLSRRIGTTVADTGAAGYRFQTLRLVSADGQRRYRLWLALPHAPAPAAGYPAVWMLDGNAALMETSAGLLGELARAPRPPVLVYVAYDNDLRIDAAARAFDYTPPLPGAAGRPQQDVLDGRRAGGADAFLTLLTGPMRVAVAARVPLDPTRQALWGHSYGGLFVLHTLFRQPQAFSTYAAVDPSLWWGEGYPLGEAQRRVRPSGHPRLWWLAGEGARGEKAAPAASARRTAAEQAAMRKARQSVPADAAPALVARLRAEGLQAEFRAMPGLSHGQTLGASLPLVLRRWAGVPEDPATGTVLDR